MMKKLHFDIRDIPACARFGLSARKIWIFFKALALSWMIWDILVYLGFLAADPGGLGSRIDSGRLLPLPSGIFWQSWQAVALLALAGLFIVAILLIASLKVSRVTFEQIRGDDFYSGRDAAEFARCNYRPVFATPLVILAGLLIAVAAGALLGLIGRIPSAGPFGVALLSVPCWGASLLVVLAAIALAVSFCLTPPIVACTRGDTFETIFELFSSLTAQPWRLAAYALASLVTRVLGFAVFLAFSSAALLFYSNVLAIGLGGSPASTLAAGLRTLAPEAVGSFSSLSDAFGLVTGAPLWTGAAGALAAISGVIVTLVLVSYWFSAGSSAWTLVYLAVRHRKDGEDLLQRAEDEDRRAFEKKYGSADESKRSGQAACAEEREGSAGS